VDTTLGVRDVIELVPKKALRVCIVSSLFVGDAQSCVTRDGLRCRFSGGHLELFAHINPRRYKGQCAWGPRNVWGLITVIGETSGECESEVSTSGVSVEDNVKFLLEAKINEVRVTRQGVD